MQGPHALANTFAPNNSKVSIKPSLFNVCLTCSEPGVIVKSAFVVKPLSIACLAIEEDLDISSYEEFVQDPIRPTLMSVGQPSLIASCFSFDIGVALSGVNGPFT